MGTGLIVTGAWTIYCLQHFLGRVSPSYATVNPEADDCIFEAKETYTMTLPKV